MLHCISQVLTPENTLAKTCIFLSEKVTLQLTQGFTVKSGGESNAYLLLIIFIIIFE